MQGYAVGDIVLIEWWDAYSELEPDEPGNIGMLVRTVGWVMPPDQENEDYIGYAQDWNEREEKYMGITYLYKPMIKSITKLVAKDVV